MEQATLLEEEFGGHTMEWYFEEIMQQSHITKSKRGTSHWNTFLWNEVKHINDGEFFHLISTLQVILILQLCPLANIIKMFPN